MQDYLQSASRDNVHQVLRELDDFLALPLSEEELSKALHEDMRLEFAFTTDSAQTNRSWLEHVREQFTNHLNVPELE